MITFKERAEQLVKNCDTIPNNGIYETLAKEFGIGKRSASDRFKSIFGMSVRDMINKKLTPSDEKVIDSLIQSDSYEEFFKLTGTNRRKTLLPILERLFRTTNYYQAKCRLQACQKHRIKSYVITLADNRAFLISQILGDGSIERDNSFKIEHGNKQYDWLKFKVGMFNTMYPQTNGVGHIKRRVSNKNYLSYTYRTGEVLKKQLDILIKSDYSGLVNMLTPLGVMVYFFDDGYLTYSKKYKTAELGFATIKPELKQALFEYFKTYGYIFNITKKSVVLQKKMDIIKFIQEFLEPFKALIPENMHYKIDYEDIVGNL